MKIKFYSHTGQMSGAEQMLLLSIDGLREKLYSVSVVCPKQGNLENELRQRGIETEDIRDIQARFTYNPLKLIMYATSTLQALIRARRVLLDGNPDCIHANSVRAGVIATLSSFGSDVPVVWHIHDMLPRHPLTWILRVVAQCSPRTSLVACSYASARTFTPVWGKGPGPDVIYNGIDMEQLQADAEIRQAKRTEIGAVDADYVVGSIGMLSERKAQLDLIRAAKILQPILSQLKVVIVGSPLFNKDEEYLERLKQEIETAGLANVVQLLGQRADARDLIQAMDVFVHTATREPFGLVIVEAMALGKVVVSTDSGGPGEIIASGENGILVPVGEPERIAQAILELSTDKERQGCISREALGIRQRFRRDQFIAKWCRHYEAITRGRTPVTQRQGL